MELTLQVEYSTAPDLTNAFGSELPESGARATLGNDGVEMVVNAHEEGLGFNDTALVQFVVSFGGNVASNIVASLVCAAVGAGVRRFLVNGQSVQPTESALTKSIDIAKEVNSKQ